MHLILLELICSLTILNVFQLSTFRSLLSHRYLYNKLSFGELKIETDQVGSSDYWIAGMISCVRHTRNGAQINTRVINLRSFDKTYPQLKKTKVHGYASITAFFPERSFSIFFFLPISFIVMLT